MSNKIDVNVLKQPVGVLSNENEKFIFTYTHIRDFVSLTMPTRTQQYVNNKLHPIFEMNLPEGYLLSIIKKHFSKIVKTDEFGILKLISKGVKGRITYNSTEDNTENSLELNDLLNPQSANLFEELVSKFALNSAISGVQPKVLANIQNKATLKYDNYIVKSWGKEYPELALNEYYCMLLAKYANIPVPEFYISSDAKLFIMKRFDILEDDTILGFEDMCVLQAKQSDEKYDGSYESIAKSIKTFVSPKYKKKSLKDFFKIIVINNILQNGDAHLKNFGLVYENIESIKLAPAYDIVSTTFYIKNDILALNLLGSKKWWDKKYILRFGMENCELTKHEVTLLYDECINASKKVLSTIETNMVKEKNEDKKSLLKHLKNLLELTLDLSQGF